MYNTLLRTLTIRVLKRSFNYKTSANNHSLYSIPNKFIACTNGNVGLLFGLLLVPLISAVGMSVDYSAAITTKAKMQVALDASALAAGRMLQTSGDTSAAEQAAIKHFNSTLSSDVTANISVDNIDASNGVIDLSATSNVDTNFMSVVGIDNIDVSVTSQAELALGGSGQKDIEVSMMLDVTGSMYGSRLSDMKLAAKDLVQIVLQGNGATQFKARIALVPFSESVNIKTYMNDVADSLSSTKTFLYKYGYNKTWYLTSNCISERTGTEAFTDAAPTGSNKINRMYTSNGSCKPSAELIPLTDDQTLLEDTIDSFYASGWTAGHLGTAWAWYTLSPNWNSVWPTANQPAEYDTEKTAKIAILMTDGVYNTQYKDHIQTRYLTYGNNSPNGSSDSQADQLCTNMKAAGVTVYTVGFELYSSTAKDTLKQCATSEDHYFLADDGDKLRAAFREIAFQIAQLRLSK